MKTLKKLLFRSYSFLFLGVVNPPVSPRDFNFSSPIDLLFGICGGCLYALGLVTGLSYVEISVIINIYLQCGLLLLSVLYLSFRAGQYVFRGGKKRIFLMLLPYQILQYAFILFFIKKYFPMSYEVAFNETMLGLQMLAKTWNITYMEVNIILYVFVYSAVMLVNWCLVYFLKNFMKIGVKSDKV